MGMTDQAIIRDIVAGERDPQTLARYRRGRIKASIKLVRTALTPIGARSTGLELEVQQSSWLVCC